MNLSYKYTIQIPKDTTIVYSSKKKILTIVGPINQKSMNLKLKITIEPIKNLIIITPEPLNNSLIANKKKIKAIQGSTVSIIKQMLIETSTILYKKLNFVGVGYRVFDVENFKNQIFMLKLGYSHNIYFKKPLDINVFCLKLTKLFIFGNSYQEISKTASLIRSFKYPEPYKGKGILYENEKITLKEGKKI